MQIKEMFKDDIERKINGVVQVEQEKEDVIKQEVKEYVVTSELKKHYTNVIKLIMLEFKSDDISADILF